MYAGPEPLIAVTARDDDKDGDGRAQRDITMTQTQIEYMPITGIDKMAEAI